MPVHRIFTGPIFESKPVTASTSTIMNERPKNYIEAYRLCRARGLTRSLALRQSQREFSALYREYFEAQNRGEKWTRECLDMTPEKHEKRLSIIANGGRLT